MGMCRPPLLLSGASWRGVVCWVWTARVCWLSEILDLRLWWSRRGAKSEAELPFLCCVIRAGHGAQSLRAYRSGPQERQQETTRQSPSRGAQFRTRRSPNTHGSVTGAQFTSCHRKSGQKSALAAIALILAAPDLDCHIGRRFWREGRRREVVIGA